MRAAATKEHSLVFSVCVSAYDSILMKLVLLSSSEAFLLIVSESFSNTFKNKTPKNEITVI